MKNKKLLLLSLLYTFSLCAEQLLQEQFWTQEYLKVVQGFWGPVESASGPGSTLAQTVVARDCIEKIIKEYHVVSLLDVPCGDFHWMSFIDLSQCNYFGCDIVRSLIENNAKRYSAHNRKFLHVDVTKDVLPQADLIVCRDLFIHLSLEDIFKALHNFKQSGAKYLLTTIFTRLRSDTNTNITSGGFRTINLQRAPFNFPAPLLVVNEQCTEQGGAYNDKSLALWSLEDIIIA